MNIFTEHWQLAVAGFFLFFGFNLLVQSEGMKGNIIRGGKGMISDKHSAPFGVLLAVCSLCVRWYSKSTTTAARSMLGHQFHSDTTRYYGDCTYVRGCVWKMERERGRERERWEWGLDITEQETISHSGVQQRRRRRGGGGLRYSHGWLADSRQWLCDLSQPCGTGGLCSGHESQDSVDWNWRDTRPIISPSR